jgi:hypothetical protein
MEAAKDDLTPPGWIAHLTERARSAFDGSNELVERPDVRRKSDGAAIRGAQSVNSWEVSYEAECHEALRASDFRPSQRNRSAQVGLTTDLSIGSLNLATNVRQQPGLWDDYENCGEGENR